MRSNKVKDALLFTLGLLGILFWGFTAGVQFERHVTKEAQNVEVRE